MHIIKLDHDTHIWRRFLQKNNTLIFHTPEWKQLIEKSFKKVKTIYFAVLDKEDIKIILPFLYIDHPMFEKKLISCGFIEYGGPAGKPDSKTLEIVFDEISRKYKNRADYLEIRQGLTEFTATLDKIDLIKKTEYKRFITRLGNSKELWKKISKQRRKAVRKAEKEGISVREIRMGDLNDVYNIYLKNMKIFGSPPLSKNFFENFFKILVLNNLARGFGAYYKGKLVALLIGYTYRNRIHIIINVSDHNYLNYRPNDAVHWAFMKWGCENGYNIFDWGRVREESGQFRFKSLWASELHNLNHYYILWKSKETPRIDPTNPKYKFLIWLWKHMPLFISKRIGPWIREGLGI